MRFQSGRQGPPAGTTRALPADLTAEIVALTSVQCLLAEVDITARDNCAVAWGDRGESPSGTEYSGYRLLHLGSAVALGVHLSVHCVSVE